MRTLEYYATLSAPTAAAVLHITDDTGTWAIGANGFAAMWSDFRQEVEIISTALSREAIDREWCTEFEDFIARVNGALPMPLTTHEDIDAIVEITIRTKVQLKHVRVDENDNNNLEAVFDNTYDYDELMRHIKAVSNAVSGEYKNFEIGVKRA